MFIQKSLKTMYEYACFLVNQGMEDLDHTASLISPPGIDNPANWILGHIITSRSNVMAMLKIDPPWDFERCKPYLPDSEPLSPVDKAEDFEEMKDIFKTSQEALMKAIKNLSEEELNTPTGENTLGEDLAGYAIHEAFHAGELSTLKNLLG